MLNQELYIIKYKDGYYAVAEMKNYEDYGSCGYCRTYKVLFLSAINDGLEESYTLLEEDATLIEVNGSKLPIEYIKAHLELDFAKNNEGKVTYSYTVTNNAKWEEVLKKSGTVESIAGSFFLGNLDLSTENSFLEILEESVLKEEDIVKVLNGKTDIELSIKIKNKKY